MNRQTVPPQRKLKRPVPAAARKTVGVLVFGLPLVSSAVAAPICALPGQDGPTFLKDTYYPGTGTAAVGATSLSIGTARVDTNAGTTALAAGDLVFIIQMQGATINTANSVSYGDGSTGRGFTALNGAGSYEFAQVKTVVGSTITLNTPLQHTYTTQAAGTTTTQQRFQVIRTPQHSALTLSGTLSAPTWNGTTGGVFVLDVAGTLSMGGATIDVSGTGFRGGGMAMQASRAGSNAVEYALSGTPGYNGGGIDATQPLPYTPGGTKGEGIAGTPRLVVNPGGTITNGAQITDLGASGYPGSADYARGAPGNAGGGGTQHNAGGGGGSNVGSGGTGGNSYATYSATSAAGCVMYSSNFYGCNGDGSRAVGGLGGGTLTASASYLIPGGGGGAGDSNDSSDNPAVAQGSGGNGGGIIFLRANAIAGSGTLKANGSDGQPAGRDAAGGGGAGGTVALATPTTALSGITVQANGGAGGNSGYPLRSGEVQGPAGGGGGGAILLPSGATLSTFQVNGGAAGVNKQSATVFNTYGSVAGAGGLGQIIFTNNEIASAAACYPNVTLTKLQRDVTTNGTFQTTPSERSRAIPSNTASCIRMPAERPAASHSPIAFQQN
ncbi:hypothetical protein MF271_23850 (plasmid) [Deinococcus sp. KNUC1210]|uniref:hypothetical protein n=1 Tax=Deinococcus sp. KNUC1210 TaxID=2917691 RepID=UPI001EEFDF69|nr:hypothetical protein [Deinococcus sp. KNUC1210]ULH17998.1 hypothetical protein MF271_23850 [Deinococcus sp. KNUC1210]